MKATKFLFLVLLGLLTLARAQPIPGESEQPSEEPQLTIEDVMSDLRDDQGVDRDDQLDPQACDPDLLMDLGDALMHKYFIIASLRTMAEDVAKGITGASPERQHVQLGLAYVSAKVLGIMSLLDGAAQSESRQFFEPSGPGGDGGGGSPGDTGQYAEGDTGDEGEGDNGGNDSENTYGGTGFAGIMRNRSGGNGGSGGSGSGGEAEGYQGGGAEGSGGSGLAGVSRNRSGGTGGSGVGGAGSYGGSATRGGSYQGRGGGNGALAMNEGSASGGGSSMSRGGSYQGRSGSGVRGGYQGAYRGRGGAAGGSSPVESRGAPGGGSTRGASASRSSGGRAVVGGPVGELVGQIANVRLILLVVALVVMGTITVTFIRIIRFFRRKARRHAGEQVAPVPIADPAMTLLKERFVKDEITREEFEKKKRELEEMSGTPAEPEHKHGHAESKPKPKDVGGEVMEP